MSCTQTYNGLRRNLISQEIKSYFLKTPGFEILRLKKSEEKDLGKKA